MSVPEIIDTAEQIESEGLGNLSAFRASAAYHRNHCVWLLPTRGMIPLRVERSWWQMQWFMNTPRDMVDMQQMEVGAAYEAGFSIAMDNPRCKSYPWVWTYEEDNVQPSDVFHKLFGAMWKCIDCGADMPTDAQGNPAAAWFCPNGHRGLDAVSGLYFTKSDPPMPMCFGDPGCEELEFRPRDISAQVAKGELVECNGIAMGCTLFRKDLFRSLSRPWFRTLSGADSNAAYTQDLFFCRKAIAEGGIRVAVHTGVIVGHLDSETGRIF